MRRAPAGRGGQGWDSHAVGRALALTPRGAGRCQLSGQVWIFLSLRHCHCPHQLCGLVWDEEGHFLFRAGNRSTPEFPYLKAVAPPSTGKAGLESILISSKGNSVRWSFTMPYLTQRKSIYILVGGKKGVMTEKREQLKQRR